MKVLIACEESQTSCIAWREAGHEAYSCDIQPCSGGHPEWHIQDDVLPLLNGFCSFVCQDGSSHSVESRWDIIIAHPPCTFLTKAGACNIPRDPSRIVKGFQAVDFFQKILHADCSRICVENPPLCLDLVCLHTISSFALIFSEIAITNPSVYGLLVFLL